MNTTTQTAALPLTVNVKGDLLYVHTGAEFKVLGRVGNLGSLKVDAAYPSGVYASKNTDWMKDSAGIAKYIATAANAYPVLRKEVVKLESQNADLVAKLKLATEAVKRSGSLTGEYAAQLVRELELCLSRNSKK